MFAFASGVLLGFRSDVANSTPINFGLIQEATFDISFTMKELYGQKQWPVAIARGTGKITGKAKMARISGLAFNNLFFGQTLAAGQLNTSFAEGPTSIPTTPFTITVVNSATFVDDLGVINAATGLPFTKVASGPTAGQYSVAAGVYTFASADNVSGIKVLISYTYTLAATGEKITVTNQLSGTTPTMQAQFFTTFQGNPLSVKFPNCVSTKLAIASKLEDFMIPEIDFSCYADAADNVMTWSFGDAA